MSFKTLIQKEHQLDWLNGFAAGKSCQQIREDFLKKTRIKDMKKKNKAIYQRLFNGL